MIGSKLGPYEILAKLGAGGMGEVFRARDTRLNRDVALKILPAEVGDHPERLERFQREAQAVAALNHPGIVTLYSIEEEGDVRFLTMEVVDGEPLAEAIPEGGLRYESWLEIGAALADAVAAAHAKGIVHRDLKPANVMVGAGGRIKVLDFGLAKRSEPDSDRPDPNAATMLKTREGAVLGTLPYMSPEQVRGGAVDERTDVFSLGVILYEMATGERPFQGDNPAELGSAILRDPPPPLASRRAELPADVERILRRCLEKDPRDRMASARALHDELRLLRRDLERADSRPSGAPRDVPRASSESGAQPAERFWIAVLPFGSRGADPGLEELAEGITEEIVTGLSRFSYLRVIAHSSTRRFAGESVDVRAVGGELGARYVMEGSIRQAGARVRIAARLVDAATGASLWAESYDRAFRAEEIFELQDDVVPTVVSTIADMNGVLPHAMSALLRGKSPDDLTPYEAVLRSFGYLERLDAEEHALVRSALERAVERAPDEADAWAMLSFVYAEEHKHDFNAQPGSLDRALEAARRAVAVAPSGHLGYHVLAQALYFRRELAAFRNAAERAVALNPMDGCTTAFMGILLSYAGDWERGCALTERAMQLNPHHPGWYRFALFNNAYRQGDYRGARDVALRFNMPSYFYTHAVLAAACAQLGESEAAGRALAELVRQKPGFAAIARRELGKWHGEGELLEGILDGLRKAGLDLPASAKASGGRATEAARAEVAIAVLPFSDLSSAHDQQYLCEGMADEIMNALVGVEGMRVASRTSAFRVREEGHDLAAIARILSVGHVLEGSVRTAGDRLRVTAQLTDAASGYQLWSERFDREAGDVFAVQDEIAAGVVAAVRAKLSAETPGVRPRRRVRNLDAYRHYLEGRHYRYTRNDHGRALQCYEQAVALDPTHAPSWVGVAEATVLAAAYCLIPTRPAFDRARRALETAAASQGESAEALYIEGIVRHAERDWVGEERALRRAVELEAEHVRARSWLGMLLMTLGRVDEGVVELERARDADQLAAYPYGMSGAALVIGGRAADAVPFSEQALLFEPDNTLALSTLGTAKLALSDPEGAVAALERAVAIGRRGAFMLGILGSALAAAGRSEEARAILEELRARPEPAPTTISEAWLLAALGERDAAWTVIGRAVEESQPMVSFLAMPGYDPLRGEERFEALRARLGLST